MVLLKAAISNLEETDELHIKNMPYKVSGTYSGFWEAQLTPLILNNY